MSTASVKARRTTREMRERHEALVESLVEVTWTVVAGPPGSVGVSVTSLEDPERLARITATRAQRAS